MVLECKMTAPSNGGNDLLRPPLDPLMALSRKKHLFRREIKLLEADCSSGQLKEDFFLVYFAISSNPSTLGLLNLFYFGEAFMRG